MVGDTYKKAIYLPGGTPVDLLTEADAERMRATTFISGLARPTDQGLVLLSTAEAGGLSITGGLRVTFAVSRHSLLGPSPAFQTLAGDWSNVMPWVSGIIRGAATVAPYAALTDAERQTVDLEVSAAIIKAQPPQQPVLPTTEIKPAVKKAQLLKAAAAAAMAAAADTLSPRCLAGQVHNHPKISFYVDAQTGLHYTESAPLCCTMTVMHVWSQPAHHAFTLEGVSTVSIDHNPLARMQSEVTHITEHILGVKAI